MTDEERAQQSLDNLQVNLPKEHEPNDIPKGVDNPVQIPPIDISFTEDELDKAIAIETKRMNLETLLHGDYPPKYKAMWAAIGGVGAIATLLATKLSGCF